MIILCQAKKNIVLRGQKMKLNDVLPYIQILKNEHWAISNSYLLKTSKMGILGKKSPSHQNSVYYIAKKTKDDPMRSYSSQFSFASS